ncbi:ATP-binding protein [Leptospira mayottensis]|uniref:AAA domain protein n=2 Tax=Leptospira mayottensis TaxID=1137606 RepID=A0AA87MMV7_9LEPT|nr:AAA family ATPase [Leptospira mayottensis]AXR60606.1 DNA repair protein Rad50 [Leptospira mayottensis]AXR64417.1 DNA repair protein Rad50 [Leptospira mayottensis]AZQ02962.1 DNA repair protein Rad50 [Leptospira mayottensis 200901116]EKR98572.1 AAA domain protein [Leptospira mayottensis 200901122]TGM96805.1 DNA repair protein Rad50 [Leptospira mayottensis]
MISGIQLSKFGKFVQKEFNLSNTVTVFFGKNESGKTTIFDALRLAIGSKFLTANQEPKKSILSRYGEKSLESYNILGNVPDLSKETAPQYVHCVSLREGELEFAFNNDKFIKPDFLRSKLLNSGIDLDGIASSLKKIHSPKTGSKDSNLFETLKKEISDLKSKRTELIFEIENLHSRNKNNAEKEEKHLRDRNREFEIKDKLAQIEKDSELDSKIQKKIKLLESLFEIQRLKSIQEFIKKNFLYAKDESSSFENLQKEIEKSRNALYSSETLLKDKENAINSKKKHLDEQQNLLPTLQKMKQKAEEWCEKIDNTLREDGFTEEIRTNHSNSSSKILGIILIGLGFLGLVGAFLLSEFSPIARSSAALISASLIVLGFFLFVQKKESVNFRYSSEKEKNFVLKISGLWNLTFPEYSIPFIEKIDHLRQFFLKQIQNFDLESRQTDILEKEIRTLSRELDTIRSTLRLESEKSAELQSKINSWLNDRKVATIQDYHKQVAELQAQSKNFSEGLKKILTDHSAKSLEDLEIRQKAMIATMDDVPTQFPNDPQRPFRDSKKKELEKELQSLETNLKELNTAIQVEEARIQDSLPEKEKDLIRTIQTLSEKELYFSNIISKRRSAIFAQELIEEISKDQSAQFSFISSEIGKEINLMLPKREISFESIDKKESIKMKDQSGEFRPIDHLSGGTLATFYLIFKLFLARKTVPKYGILLLDEPFVHLDIERIDSALSYLKTFQEETRYQICFFTKQEELAEIVLKIFQNSIKIPL